MAGALVQLGLITASVVGGVALLGMLARLFCGTVRLDRLARWRARRAPVASHRPLERVAADLRRLSRQLALVPAGAPQARRRGLQAAYDDVLVEAAALLDVPHTLRTAPAGMARDVERMRLQAALEDAGLVPHH